MANCDVCGSHIDLPYDCRGCGGTFCGEHRLPENHQCAGLDDWNDPGGVFDSGFDDSVGGRGSSGTLDRVTPDFGAGGLTGYFRGNLAYTFLAIMVLTFVVQVAVANLAPELFATLFVLSSAHPEYVWTWVTSVFSHGSPIHLFGNAIVMFFFGPVLERKIGSKRFGALFLGAGMVAGLAQIFSGYLLGNPVASGVLGASGGIMAILATLSVLNPDLKVYLYFVLPIPIWVLTIGYAALSVVGVFSSFSVLGGNIAHLAHLAGLFIGAAYGVRLKGKVSAPSELRFGGGRGGGGLGGPGRGRF